MFIPDSIRRQAFSYYYGATSSPLNKLLKAFKNENFCYAKERERGSYESSSREKSQISLNNSEENFQNKKSADIIFLKFSGWGDFPQPSFFGKISHCLLHSP